MDSIQARTQTTLDYQSRIHPEIASDFMVVSQNEHATKVGFDILQKGGNAVDASVAVGFALAVTLPRAGNLGGGGFILIYDAETDDIRRVYKASRREGGRRHRRETQRSCRPCDIRAVEKGLGHSFYPAA